MDAAPRSSIRPRRSVSVSFLLVAGGFLLFSALTWFTVVNNRAVSLDEERAVERRQILDETLAAQKNLATTAGWVDEAGGIARIPIDDAMGMALVKLRDKPVRPSQVLTDKAMAAKAAADAANAEDAEDAPPIDQNAAPETGPQEPGQTAPDALDSSGDESNTPPPASGEVSQTNL